MANFILLCFQKGKNTYLQQLSETKRETEKNREEQETYKAVYKQTNQEIKPFEYVNIFTDYYTQKKTTKKTLILNHVGKISSERSRMQEKQIYTRKQTKTYFTQELYTLIYRHTCRIAIFLQYDFFQVSFRVQRTCSSF